MTNGCDQLHYILYDIFYYICIIYLRLLSNWSCVTEVNNLLLIKKNTNWIMIGSKFVLLNDILVFNLFILF